MEQNNEIVVEYRRQGDDVHLLDVGSVAIPNLTIDYTDIPRAQRGGTATRLLSAAALYCFAGTLATALASRGATINSMTGRAVATRGKDANNRSKITDIRVEIDVEVNDADLPILEKCQRIMQSGCLVTYSLDNAVHVEHVIRRFRSNGDTP